MIAYHTIMSCVVGFLVGILKNFWLKVFKFSRQKMDDDRVLPLEIVLIICEYGEWRSIFSFAQTCRSYLNVLQPIHLTRLLKEFSRPLTIQNPSLMNLDQLMLLCRRQAFLGNPPTKGYFVSVMIRGEGTYLLMHQSRGAFWETWTRGGGYFVNYGEEGKCLPLGEASILGCRLSIGEKLAIQSIAARSYDITLFYDGKIQITDRYALSMTILVDGIVKMSCGKRRLVLYGDGTLEAIDHDMIIPDIYHCNLSSEINIVDICTSIRDLSAALLDANGKVHFINPYGMKTILKLNQRVLFFEFGYDYLFLSCEDGYLRRYCIDDDYLELLNHIEGLNYISHFHSKGMETAALTRTGRLFIITSRLGLPDNDKPDIIEIDL